ncbi:MAG: hypothetical protein ACJ8NS_01935 [Chthoniobacterales bacterium]
MTAVTRKAVLLLVTFTVIAQAAAAERTDKIFIQGNLAGTETVKEEAGGFHAEYSYNDRGRGDHIIATWKLDAAGVPTEYHGTGNDYMKAPVEERFEIKNGKASWKNRSEQGEQPVKGEAFYLPMSAPPEFFAVLARALLKAPNHKLPLLPAGAASIEAAGKAKTGKGELTEYRITGLSFSPQSIWMDNAGVASTISGWFSVVPDGSESAIKELQAAQDKTDAAWSEQLARALAHKPTAELVIRNAHLFDPRDLSVTAGTSVSIRGDRIVRVGPDGETKPAADAEIVDSLCRAFGTITSILAAVTARLILRMASPALATWRMTSTLSRRASRDSTRAANSVLAF